MQLTTEQLARMSRLLDEAIELDEAGRQRWLQALPSQHRDLEAALRKGLFPPPGDIFGSEAMARLDGIRAELGAPTDSGLRAGERIGPYQLSQRLGAGGMAEVWLAQRADGAFKRRVALKIPLRLQWREDLARRFVIERDILASLEHPHIARFYDAGLSEDGRPYLALEYVDGTNLLQWADAQRLGIRQRIELMLQVLEAVEYAHRRGVLHRDLKPSNVLVTDAGRVSLLDFGVARMMQRTADDTTQVYGTALTPAYASPEQIAGDPVDAASDVYSLGVMLYELLCGRPPRVTATAATGPDATVTPPSVRVDAEAAAARGGSTSRVRQALAKELDAVVLKALSRMPAERYGSAAALARDLHAFLAGDMVQAVPPSVRYRMTKFLARHRVGLTLTAALAAGAVGLAAALLQVPDAAQVPVAEVAANPPAAPQVPADKSVAVLPFADLSETRDQQYFSDGLSEELIDRLAHRPDLRVIARTSAFAFRDSNEDVRSIAARLGVAFVLVGSVRNSATALRISARLHRASDGSPVWSQTYERARSEIFKVQDEIAQDVARVLRSAVEQKAQREARAPGIDAYNLVLQGDVYSNGPFKRDAERAEVLFRKAAALDPGYAMPWVKLGLLYMRQARLSWAPTNEGNAGARDAIDNALRIDPNLMAARAARYRYLVRVEHQWAEARAELDRMRNIDLNDALYLPDCEAHFASITGHLDEAIKIQRQILDRDPLNASAIGTLGQYLFDSGRLEESMALFRRELQLNPHAVGNRSLIGVALALLGKGTEALAEAAEESHQGYRLWAQSIAHWTLGRKVEADAALHELKKYGSGNAYSIAQIHALRGERNPAFEWLTAACAARHSGCERIRVDRFLRGLHDDPRYRTLLARMKLDGDPPVSAR
jgi:serine/threonine protein kinase/TolB-like protein